VVSKNQSTLTRQIRFSPWFLILVLLTTLMVFSFSPGLAQEKKSVSSPSEISFPVSQFADGKARHFTYPAPGGVTIKYFIIKSSDGVIRAAFDACDVCWPSGKGYQQEGDNMVCRNCGKKFASKLVNEVKGGCNPAPLKRTIRGNQLIIQAKDVLDGRNYFNF
jgi:uncharacterized membrane protein